VNGKRREARDAFGHGVSLGADPYRKSNDPVYRRGEGSVVTKQMVPNSAISFDKSQIAGLSAGD
jgi:hypothetical protein